MGCRKNGAGKVAKTGEKSEVARWFTLRICYVSF